MKSVGPLFVNTLKLNHPLTPIFEWGWTQETEEPFRKSKTCFVVWLPFLPRGYAFGVWGDPQSEAVAYSAMGTREVAKFGNVPVGSKSKDVSEW